MTRELKTSSKVEAARSASVAAAAATASFGIFRKKGKKRGASDSP